MEQRPFEPKTPRSCSPGWMLCWVLAGVAMLGSAGSTAQPTSASNPRVASGSIGSGPTWSQLTAEQRTSLAPLQRDWPGIDADQKRKWLEVSARFPKMPADERERVQARMGDWARMTPQDRGRARLRFQQAQGVAPQDRQARWDAYQALPAEQRSQLAAKNVPPAKSQPGLDARNGRGAGQVKSNIVPNPSFAAPPKPVSPTVVQAAPGASTRLMSKPPAPPPHQQTGLPKIAASPGFVDRRTLLPKRGPQGAATRSASALVAPEPGQRTEHK
jgi:Protein of unknown function (DUF3106)